MLRDYIFKRKSRKQMHWWKMENLTYDYIYICMYACIHSHIWCTRQAEGKVFVLIRHCIMKVLRKWVLVFQHGSAWTRVVSYTLRSFYPMVRAASTDWIRDWVGPRTVLDILENREPLACAGNQTKFPRGFSPQVRLYCTLAIPFVDRCEEFQNQVRGLQ
jgi:hypothetical protein